MKKININRDKLFSFIENLKEEYDVSVDKKHDSLYVYKFIKSGEEPALLNVYFNNNGTTTLQHKVGKNKDLSYEIASKIKDKSSIREFRSNSFYVKSIREEDFNLLIDFLKDENEILTDETINNRRIVKVKGKQGDELTVQRHQNGSFQVQGKPRMLFNDLIYILSEFLPFKEVIESQLKFYETELTANDILGELQNILPKSYNFINDKIISILSSSIVLMKIDADFKDYSFLTCPALRALEGVLKQVFKDNGIIIVNSKGFSDYVNNNGVNSYLSEIGKEKIKDIKTQNVIKKLHELFANQRNSLMHVDGLIETTRIINYIEAKTIVLKIFDILEKEFSKLYINES